MKEYPTMAKKGKSCEYANWVQLQAAFSSQVRRPAGCQTDVVDRDRAVQPWISAISFVEQACWSRLYVHRGGRGPNKKMNLVEKQSQLHGSP